MPNEAEYEVTDALVRDQVTGLVWQRVASPEFFSWREARAYCASLELEGRPDFRLPGRIELVTILDFRNLPVIASAFGGGASEYHFTSSPASFVTGSAYSVYFGAGETTIASADPGRARVRCVAGSVGSSAVGLEIDGEHVRDRATGLLWERASAPPAVLVEAAERCRALDMRLPSIRELQSIVDETRHRPAIDPELFPGVTPEGFWSSSVRGTDPWYVDFLDGKTYADRLPSESLSSRCVR